MLLALDFALGEPRRAVIAGDVTTRDVQQLLRAAHAVYQPNKIVLVTTGAVEEFARTLPMKDGAVVYLCTGNVCQPPTSDAEKVKEMLR